MNALNRSLPFLLFFISLFGVLKAQEKNSISLEKALKEKNVFLVDVRSPSEFSSGSVNGAVNIPLDKITSQLAKFKDKKTIVVFCRSGNRSSQAKSILEQNGFKNVINGGTWENIKKIIENEQRK